MRNEDNGHVGIVEQVVQSRIDRALRFRVQGTGSFVHEQNRGISNQRSGYSDSLSLASRKRVLVDWNIQLAVIFRYKLHKVILTDGVVAILHVVDETAVRYLGSPYDILTTRVRVTIGDILVDCSAEQDRVLGNNTDSRSP